MTQSLQRQSMPKNFGAQIKDPDTPKHKIGLGNLISSKENIEKPAAFTSPNQYFSSKYESEILSLSSKSSNLLPKTKELELNFDLTSFISAHFNYESFANSIPPRLTSATSSFARTIADLKIGTPNNKESTGYLAPFDAIIDAEHFDR